MDTVISGMSANIAITRSIGKDGIEGDDGGDRPIMADQSGPIYGQLLRPEGYYGSDLADIGYGLGTDTGKLVG